MVFDVSEIFEVAITIEENGERFYRKVATKVGDEETQTVFLELADAEVTHKQLFQQMASQLGTYEPEESYPGEYLAYLRGYVDRIIFDPQNVAPEAEAVTHPLAAIQFAIRRELDSILYYQEVKTLVPRHQHKNIDKIIEEERRHYLTLVDLEKRYESGERR